MIYQIGLLQRVFRLAGLLLLVVLMGAALPASASPPGDLAPLIKETATGWVPQPDMRDDPPPTVLRAALCPVFGAGSPLFLFPALPPADSDFKKWLERLEGSQYSHNIQDVPRELASPQPVYPPLCPVFFVQTAVSAQPVHPLAAVLWYGPALYAIPPPAALV